MHEGGFRVSTTTDGDEVVVAIAGEIDLATAPRVAAAFAALDGARNVRVDLTEVTFLDASGLNVFVHAAARAESHDGRVTFELRAPIVRKVFVAAGLAQLLDDDAR